MTDAQDTTRLDRAIQVAEEMTALHRHGGSGLGAWARVYAKALIADILLPDPPEPGVETINMGGGYDHGAHAENYAIRKRACLLTAEELAREAWADGEGAP